jgi:hypothetical protein
MLIIHKFNNFKSVRELGYRLGGQAFGWSVDLCGLAYVLTNRIGSAINFLNAVKANQYEYEIVIKLRNYLLVSKKPIYKLSHV